MDKIYSRPRIKLVYSNKKKLKKKLAIIFIMLIASFTVVNSIKSINPIFEELCKDTAMEMSSLILNEESLAALKKYNYKDIVSITKTDNNNILKTDVEVINDIASDITVAVTKRFKDINNTNIKIPLGAIFGSKILSGFGPKINISIIPSGNITTEIKTEFKEEGINQTVYRIYLDVVFNETILTSYKTIDTKITNQVLLVETVIVGDTPQTYYNLEGIDKEDSLNIIE